MAEVVNTSLDEMGIWNKTLGFTVDNAGSNGMMLKQLQNEPDLKLSPDMHFWCFAHVMNLATQNTTESMKGSITSIRDTGHATRYYPRKMNQLEEYCKSNKDENGQSAPIKFLKPVMDVKTRWNST